MIKLAIFGDSFAQDISPQWETTWADVGPSWIDHLRATNKYAVTNFANSGTSLYWSKKLFDKIHGDFDKIIFVVTFPCRRITFDKLPDGCTQITNTFYNSSTVFDIIENKNKFNSYNVIEQNFLLAVRDYYLHIQNDHFDHTVHSAILDDINEKRPDTIIIPAFPSSVPAMDKINSSPLLYIAQKDMLHFGLGEFLPNSASMTDARKCHLSEENNKILATHMLQFLEGKPVYLDVNKFVTPVKHLTHYFRKP